MPSVIQKGCRGQGLKQTNKQSLEGAYYCVIDTSYCVVLNVPRCHLQRCPFCYDRIRIYQLWPVFDSHSLGLQIHGTYYLSMRYYQAAGSSLSSRTSSSYRRIAQHNSSQRSSSWYVSMANCTVKRARTQRTRGHRKEYIGEFNKFFFHLCL